MLRLNTTAKDNDEDDLYSRYFFSMFMLWLVWWVSLMWLVWLGTGGRSHWTFVQRREWFDVGHWRRFHQTSNGQYIDEQWIFPFAFGHGDRARSDQPHHERYVSRLWCFLTPSRILIFLDLLSIPFDSFRFLSVPCSLAVTTVGKLSLVDLAGEISVLVMHVDTCWYNTVYYSLYYFSLYFTL